MRPRIGVLPLYNSQNKTLWINPLYFGGIEEHGGLPVMLPLSRNPEYWESYIDEFDGFLFTGGQDIAPKIYDEEKLDICSYQAEMRDNQELYMIRRIIEVDKPVLGICRGIQMLNAACGGTLYQDLPNQHPSKVVHRQEMPYDIPHHQITISEHTTLHDIVKKTHISVNSMHHQAVKDTAPEFIVSAVAEDGIVEAIEHPGRKFVLGIQWHPEYMWPHYESANKIWTSFVDACK